MDALERILAMKGGHGEDSYAGNSKYQGYMFQLIRDRLVEAIEKLDFANFGSTVQVADLGCAAGPNTISTVGVITESIHAVCDSHGPGNVPEIMVSFCDLPSNDFNSLFQQLSSRIGDSSDAERFSQPNQFEARPSYFAAGVSGSFYGRLFPRSSLHIAISSEALHWLSRVPPSIRHMDSPAWNTGSLWNRGAGVSPATLEAYSEQSRADVEAFFRCRAEELVPGGLLLLFFFGRNEGADISGSLLNDQAYDLERAWKQLIDEGVLGATSLDEFNLPLVQRSLKEVRRAIDGCGDFTIEKLELIEKVPIMEEEKWVALSTNTDDSAWSKLRKNLTMSVYGSLLEAKLGSQMTATLMQRFEHLTAQNTPPNIITQDHILAILTRK